MKDNLIIKALIECISQKLTEQGFTSFEVSRSAQPTDQYLGADIDSRIKTQIFLHQISHKILQNAATEYKGEIESNRAVKVQIDCFHYYDIRDFDAFTPDDIAELISDMLFARDTIRCLREQGIRLESRTGIRPSFYINDKEHFENVASFDIVITYTNHRKTSNKHIIGVNHNAISLD